MVRSLEWFACISCNKTAVIMALKCKHKRPTGRPPIGAKFVEEEGRYEYTKEYYDIREQVLLKRRLTSRKQSKQRSQLLKNARPYLWEKNKACTLDNFIKLKTNDGRKSTCTDLRGTQFPECQCIPQRPETEGDSSSTKGCGGVC